MAILRSIYLCNKCLLLSEMSNNYQSRSHSFVGIQYRTRYPSLPPSPPPEFAQPPITPLKGKRLQQLQPGVSYASPVDSPISQFKNKLSKYLQASKRTVKPRHELQKAEKDFYNCFRPSQSFYFQRHSLSLRMDPTRHHLYQGVLGEQMGKSKSIIIVRKAPRREYSKEERLKSETPIHHTQPKFHQLHHQRVVTQAERSSKEVNIDSKLANALKEILAVNLGASVFVPMLGRREIEEQTSDPVLIKHMQIGPKPQIPKQRKDLANRRKWLKTSEDEQIGPWRKKQSDFDAFCN